MTAVLCYIAQAYSPIKIPFAPKGLGNSRMFAHDSPAAFLSIYKVKQQQQKKNGGVTAVLYFYSVVGWRSHRILADNYRRLKFHFALVVEALSNLILMPSKKHGAYNRRKTRTTILRFLLSGV